MKRLLVALLVCAVTGLPARAGHELSFYPSYYPQEIRIETHDPAAAAALLQKSALHAYVGGDPFAGTTAPVELQSIESLGSYLVLTFAPGAAGWSPEARCATARGVAGELASAPGRYTIHPYPITPFHADYLHHFDRAAAAKAASVARTVGQTGPALRPRAVGSRVEALVRRHWPLATGDANATIEDVPIAELVAPRATSLNAAFGPPWIKEGWFHAYLVQRDALRDGTAKQVVDDLYRRLTTGQYDAGPERLDLERELVARLGAGCERVVLGYATRRERFNAEFSAGIENVAGDSQSGLNSAIFVRTAKLKDFPWNGWLTLGVPAAATAAWNPIGGFTDPTGRLVWWALGDPAFFPAPQSASWIGNRATVASVTPASEVPKDALLPEPGTGILREVGRPGKPAAVKIVYKVLASAFHDGTRMTVADTLYGLSFAYRWGAPGGPLHDPAVEAGTARLRNWLAGLKVVRVDTSEREFGEVKFTSVVQTIEVYGRYRLADDQQTAAIAPPWSAVPWTVLWLSELAAKSKLAAFSADEARRLGVPWLDLARGPRVLSFMAQAVGDAAREGPMPDALVGRVTRADAIERWTALREFYKAHKHFLVTNGPYRLDSWSDDAVVLSVFRDLAYPLGVGSYDRYPLPLRAYPANIETRGDRVEVQADVDVVEKFQREYRITRQPLRPANVDQQDLPVCRYVAIGPDGRVVAAGAAPYAGGGVFSLDLGRLPKSGPLTLLVALVVRENQVDLEIRMLQVERR